MKQFDKIPAAAAEKIFACTTSAGIPVEDVCRESGLDPRMFSKPDSRMPFSYLFLLYNAAERLMGDPDIGLHVAERDDPKSYGLLGYVTINSRNVGDGLARLARFQPLRSQAAAFRLHTVGNKAGLVYSYYLKVSRETARHEAEQTLCSIIRFGRSVTGTDWTPIEVHFEHRRPVDISEHERIFRSPVRFGRPANKLIFDASFLRVPLMNVDPLLGTLLEEQAEELLARDSDEPSTFLGGVRSSITDSLAEGEPTIAAIARQANMSGRTLQRRLSEEGTTFQNVLQQTRCELAKYYLSRPAIPITEISYLLGFSQPSVFHRAFRRWTGTTALSFRNRMISDNRPGDWR